MRRRARCVTARELSLGKASSLVRCYVRECRKDCSKLEYKTFAGQRASHDELPRGCVILPLQRSTTHTFAFLAPHSYSYAPPPPSSFP